MDTKIGVGKIIGVAIAALAAIAIFFVILTHSVIPNHPPQPQASTQIPTPKVALTEQQRAELIAKATHGMEVDQDKMERVSFYMEPDPWPEKSKQPIDVYLSIPDNSRVIFRIRPRYIGDEWLFFQHIKVMADDRIVYDKGFSYAETRHTTSGTRVFESVDYAAHEEDIEAMRKIAAAKSVTVRLSGTEGRVADYEMLKIDQSRIEKTLEAYDQLQPLSS